MHPDLLSLGPLTIHTYGAMMALGFLLAWFFANRLCKKTGQNPDYLSALLSWLMLSGVLGARIAYVWEHWESEFASHPAAIIRIDQGGLMFYGGLIAAALALVLYTAATRKKLLTVTDLVLTVVPLGHAFGRVGCFFFGCCYGRQVSSPLSVCFPQMSPAWYEQLNAKLIPQTAVESLPVLPTQLFEAAALAVLFIVLYFRYQKNRVMAGRQSALYLISYACIRFVIEYLRGDPRMEVGPLSISQTISCGVLLLGLALLVTSRGKGSSRPSR